MPEARPVQRPPRRWARLVLGTVLGGAALIAAGNVYVVSTTRAAIAAGVEVAPVRPHVIVLGNFVSPRGIPSEELAERLETGRALYQAGRARQIIVSGLVRGDAYDEPHAMAAWMVAHGVPAEDVIVDVGGHRTAATMADAVALGVRSALVVTQAYHLPRALYLARHAGIDAVGVAAAIGPISDPTLTRIRVRETLARAEVVLEVALRGVRG